jgi:hypothetical protein
MTPLAQRIATAVYENSPHLFCFACLAVQQGVKEHDVRAVALLVIVRAGFQLVRRVCSRCRLSGETVVPPARRSEGHHQHSSKVTQRMERDGAD